MKSRPFVKKTSTSVHINKVNIEGISISHFYLRVPSLLRKDFFSEKETQDLCQVAQTVSQPGDFFYITR